MFRRYGFSGLPKGTLRIIMLTAPLMLVSCWGQGCPFQGVDAVRSGGASLDDPYADAINARDLTLNFADFLAGICSAMGHSDPNCDSRVRAARAAAQGIDDAIQAAGGSYSSVATARITDAIGAAAVEAAFAYNYCKLNYGVWPNAANMPNIPGFNQTFWDVAVH